MLEQKDELISVIIPVYKVEDYLEKCVNSITQQTYQNLEIILVDDGSPDTCPQICDKLQKRDPRIKVIHKTNGGLSDARNIGVEKSKGEYILFVDSDDYLELYAIEELYKNLKESKAEASCAKFAYVYDDDKGISITDNKTQVFTSDEVMLKYAENEGVFFTVAICKLLKKNLLKNIQFPVGRLHEDEFTTYKYLCNASKIVFTDDTLYRYYQRAGSIIHTKNIKRQIDAIDAHIQKLEYCKMYKGNIYEEFKYNYFYFLIYPYIKIMSSKEIEKETKNHYCNTIKKLKENKKVKFNFKVNLFIKLPKLMYFLYGLKNKGE